jgi:hypothetical protein
VRQLHTPVEPDDGGGAMIEWAARIIASMAVAPSSSPRSMPAAVGQRAGLAVGLHLEQVSIENWLRSPWLIASSSPAGRRPAIRPAPMCIAPCAAHASHEALKAPC